MITTEICPPSRKQSNHTDQVYNDHNTYFILRKKVICRNVVSGLFCQLQTNNILQNQINRTTQRQAQYTQNIVSYNHTQHPLHSHRKRKYHQYTQNTEREILNIRHQTNLQVKLIPQYKYAIKYQG